MTGVAVAAVAWLAAIVAVERLARRYVESRAAGWLMAYLVIGGIGLAVGPAARPSVEASWLAIGGAILAAVGYPAGRLLMRDRPARPPQDGPALELVALALVVAPVEELVWGAIVEPAIGVPATALLFAAKHPLVDHNWRRTLGLFLFWLGLGALRTVSWPAALALHIGLNAGGVVLGHRTGADQF